MTNETETKSKKPIWKKWWFWIIAIFVIIIITPSDGEEKKKTAPEQQLQQEQEQEQEQTQPEQTLQSSQQTQKGTELSDKEAMAVMKITLKNYGLYDISMKIADGRDKGGARVLILGYKSTATTAIELAEESGAVLGSYTSGVKNGWDIDELSVIVGDTQGTAVGMWYCSKEWTDDFVAGKTSIEELSAKVLATMTTF